MASDAGDLGGFMGSQARGYLLNRYKINGETGERRPGAGENDKWYDVLGAGFFEYAGKATNMVKNGLKDAGEWVRNTAGDFVESAGNLFQRGEFATDEYLQRARDIERSNQYWAKVEAYKNRYLTLSEESIMDRMAWHVDSNGDLLMGMGGADAFGTRDQGEMERYRMLAVQSANGITDSGSFNLPNVMEYGSEDFFKMKQLLGYYDDKNGPTLSIKEWDNGTTQFIETNGDGSEKSIHVFNGGQRIAEIYEYYNENKKTSDDVFMYNGDNISFATRHYDRSGVNVYESSVYNLNSQSGEYEHQFTDKWLVGSDGNVIPDYKQYNYSDRMNTNIAQKRWVDSKNSWDSKMVETITIRSEGCLTTATSMVDKFFRGDNGLDPREMIQFINDNKLWVGNSNTINMGIVSQKLGYEYYNKEIGSNGYTQLDAIQQIEYNLEGNIPTYIRYSGHSAIITGASSLSD